MLIIIVLFIIRLIRSGKTDAEIASAVMKKFGLDVGPKEIRRLRKELK